MYHVIVRGAVEGTKAVAPHVARGVHHVAPIVGQQAARLGHHVASQVPSVATKIGGATGAAGVVGGVHHVGKHASKFWHAAEELGKEAAVGEALHAIAAFGIKKLGRDDKE